MWRILAMLGLLIASSTAVSDDESESSEVQSSRTRDVEQLSSSRQAEREGKAAEHEIEASSRKKVKIKLKKKDKKFLKEILMVGLLIKSALLPLAIGALKLLTGKALLMTLMALGLVTVLTFRSATEHKGSTTEIINLVPHGHHHRSFADNLPDLLSRQSFKKW